jgi:light-independent protochlorophyllide reductase subunit B
MMGLEEHLIGMFRGDFEFHEDAAPSHLGSSSPTPVHEEETVEVVATEPVAAVAAGPVEVVAASAAPILVAGWAPEAERELHKIPFFVRGKARRNTERYAHELGLPTITVETLYDAKAHFSR